MARVEQELEKRLKQLRVRVDVPDGDTVLLRNVPANGRFFSKSRTNLLIKRPRQGLPYLICVDEDLDYTGTDSEMTRAFVGGHKQQGWRVLSVGHCAGADLRQVMEEALSVVGFDGREPELKVQAPLAEPLASGKLLASFATEVTTSAADEPTIGREERTEEVASSLLQWQVRLPLIVGESGVGKTNLVRAVARKLRQLRPAFKVLSVELGAVMAGTLFDSERESLLIALLKDVTDASEAIVVLEHLEMALLGVPRGHLLLGQALDRGARLIGTTLPGYQSRFEIEPLSRRVQVTELAEMSLGETGEVVSLLGNRIAEHHQIGIGATPLESIVEAALPLDGRFPAKAIALLDAACARAVLAGENELSLFDVYSTAARFRQDDNS
ncbi:MAG TPA: AAA family ATPase [Blastocatellia bacterium]|nr:AAA family ATPase [Blastocatellia bacterium]